MKGSIMRPVTVLAGTALVAAGIALPAVAQDDKTPATEQATEATVADSAEEDAPVADDSTDETDVTEDETESSENEEAPVEEETTPDEEADDAEDGQSTINILTFSDFHGYLAQVPNMMCQVSAVWDENFANVFFASNGDNVGGSAYISAVDNDEPTIELLNDMGVNVSNVGNHEFDRGQDDLVNRLYQKAAFQYVTANVEGLDDVISEYVVYRAGNGLDVAFVGAIAEDLPSLVDKAGIEGLTVTDPVAAVDRVAGQLKDGNEENGEADIVVALIHEDHTIASQVGSNVDAVVAGHSHVEYIGETASGAPVIQPGSFGTLLGQVDLNVDEEGNIVSTSAVNHPVVNFENDETACADPAFKEKYQKFKAQADELGKEPIGMIDGKARRGTNMGYDPDLAGNENRGTESSAGNLIAQGFYEFSNMNGFGADFGIINAGGVRADLDPNADGVITRGESQTTQPFDGDIGTVDLTSKQVFELLEQQWKGPDASRPVLALGLSDSISYTYNPEAPMGSKVTSVKIHGEYLDPNDEETTYTVIAGTFLLGGGDGFTALSDGKNFKNLGYKDLTAFNEFLKANQGWKVSYQQRAIAVGALPALKAGAEVTIDLGSLSMTADEEKPEMVSILDAEGNELGSAMVDNTVTPMMPETGQASITFTVPEGLKPGMYEFTVTDGTYSYPVALEIAGADEPTTPGDDKDDDSDDQDDADDQDGTGSATETPTQPGGSLAKTGVNTAGLALLGMILLIGGVGAVAANYRRAN